MDTIIKAKICLDRGGTVQDPGQGEEGKVFICSKQKIVKDVFPVVKKLSERGYDYKYLLADKCFGWKCPKKGEEGNKGGRINIGRGNKLVLSCDVAEGICQNR